MSRQKKDAPPPGSGKRERYVQPSILMGLYSRSSYGYELIQTMREFGFIEGTAPPGMIYRHLRQLEEDGLVVSRWQTESAGPAKRIYTLTADGCDLLGLWVDHMTEQAEKLQRFVARYRQAVAEAEQAESE